MDRNDLDLEDGRNRAAAAAVALDPALPPADAAVPAMPGNAGAAVPLGGTLPANSTIVFIDAAFAEQAPHIAAHGVETVVLAAGGDGIDQIADHLAGYPFPRPTTIGIVAPGEAGAITIGDSTLSLDTVGHFAKPLAEIGAALPPGGRLLFQAPGLAGDPAIGHALRGRIADAAGVRVGTATAGGSDAGATGALDPQIWAAVNGLTPNILDHADSLNGTASNSGTASFATSLGLLHVGDVTFAPADNLFFIVEDNGSGDEKILSGNLSQAVGGSITALTTLFSDTNTLDGISGGLGVDPLHQQIYFVDGQLNASGETTLSYFERMSFTGSSLTTLATFQGLLPSGSGGGIPGMALDLAHSNAYFTWEEGGSISTQIVGGNDRLYMASGLNSGTVTLSPLPLTGFPSSTAFIESLAIDPINQVLYFTAGYSGEDDKGGVFAYNLVGNSTGTFSTVFSQSGLANNATTPWGDPRWIEVDPVSGKYYISVVQNNPTAGNQSGIFVGNLSDHGVTPSLFLATTSATGSAPEGLALDYFPTVTPGHSTGFYTEGAASVIDSALTLTDPWTNTSLTPGGTLDLSSASVVIGGFLTGDTLTAATSGTAIVASGGTNGTLTLSGVDTLVHYQSVLESVAFNTTAADTAGATRTVTFTVSDGLLSGTATETLAPAAEAPIIGGTATFSGSEEGSIALSGVTVSQNDSDDTLGTSVTISGVLAGWSVVDPGVTTIAGSSSSSGTVALADLGNLVVIAPDAGADATDSLTLVATSSEGSSSATATATLAVTATAGAAEAPTLSVGDTTMMPGPSSSQAPLTVSVTAVDADDTLGLVTITGLPSGFSLNLGTDQGGGTWTEAVSDLPSLQIIAPANDSTTTLTLGVTAGASEGGPSATATATLQVDIAPCYRSGTLILTERGERPVEALAIGDNVVTLSGAARPIRWIGRRAYDGRFIAGRRDILPVCITAGALADGVPARDLWLSPAHSLYLDGLLAQAEHLVNGATIVRVESVASVEYFHIELDTHDVIFADGAPAETFVDCDNRLMFANASEYGALYPQDERPRWAFCRERLEWGSPLLTAIRARLLSRAEALGHVLERDPGLHLLVDGRAIAPDAIAGGRYRFTLPAGSDDVRLASRRAVPAEVAAAARDFRALGVPVERIVLGDGDVVIEAWHGYAGFADGFHGDEASHRWTDGAARVPHALLRPFAGPIEVEVHLFPTSLGYRVTPSAAGDAAA